jgi:N-acetylglutamate synthase-like GNAT family acetyltransferase
MEFQIRTAMLSDRDSVELLIKISLRKLGLLHYASEQIESALKSIWRINTQLITDKTYFVVKLNQGIVGCGGWSYRESIFGNNSKPNSDPHPINLKTGIAKIQAFFVSPDFTRQGIGSIIMKKCEGEALLKGFKKFELMSTISGEIFFEKHNFIAGHPINYPLRNQLPIKLIPMSKNF